MRILWLSWKDIRHPLAGGAEVVTDEILTRLAKEGHDVTLITATYRRATPEDSINGYKVVRRGGRLTVYSQARLYIRQNLGEQPDLLIEEINTIPFFSYRLKLKSPRFLFIHQLAREIWFYQAVFPISFFGYLLEPLYLRLLSKEKVITVSDSTKSDLLRHGFRAENIRVISEGIELEPVKSLKDVKKFDSPTILSLGALRPMKRTLAQVKAFEIAKKSLPDLRMIIAGSLSDPYAARVQAYVKRNPFFESIEIRGRISKEEKIGLMQQAHVVLVTSVKEGWCLVVTEANSQGTPAVVYNVSGLRDSVKNGKTGLIVMENTPSSLAAATVRLLSDGVFYKQAQMAGWEWSRQITFDQCYNDFKEVVNL
jgi:glycosyltransferase involved in cell wall biosynthesis